MTGSNPRYARPAAWTRRRALALLGSALAAGVATAIVLRLTTSGVHRRPPQIPSHIETWAYDDGCNGGNGASTAFVRRWVTFAESNCGPAATKALTDCHDAVARYCTAVQYLDASKIYRDSVPIAQVAQESWWLHVSGHRDESHRLVVSDFGGGNQLNQANLAVDDWFTRYVRADYNADDGLMVDDTAASLKAEFGNVAVKEVRTAEALQAAHRKLAGALTHRDGSPFLQIDNGITANPYLTPSILLLDRPAAVRGLIDEGEPVHGGIMPNAQWGYPTLLDDMAYVDHTPSDFEVLLSYDPNGSKRARRLQAATVLLGYAPGHIVSWSNLEQNSKDLAVWPEEGVVPTSPVQSMSRPGGSHCLEGTGVVCATGGHSDLQVAPGVYRREFRTCYDQGVAFGGCAVVVNSTGSPVTLRGAWLRQRYAHQIRLVGGDTQSGGTLDLRATRFIAGSTILGPQDALLLAMR